MTRGGGQTYRSCALDKETGNGNRSRDKMMAHAWIIQPCTACHAPVTQYEQSPLGALAGSVSRRAPFSGLPAAA